MLSCLGIGAVIAALFFEALAVIAIVASSCSVITERRASREGVATLQKHILRIPASPQSYE
ncbi:MAG: hypothetical protein ACK5QS_13900 [Pseudanabaenaceae cyanobacterium]